MKHFTLKVSWEIKGNFPIHNNVVNHKFPLDVVLGQTERKAREIALDTPGSPFVCFAEAIITKVRNNVILYAEEEVVCQNIGSHQGN